MARKNMATMAGTLCQAARACARPNCPEPKFFCSPDVRQGARRLPCKANATQALATTKAEGCSVEDLLVLADGSPAAANALAYAETLAPDGHVTALMFGLMRGTRQASLAGEAWLVARRDAEAAAERAEVAFREKLSQRGRVRRCAVSTLFPEKRGASWRRGRYVDAVVIGLPKSDEIRPVREFEAVLFNAGRPSVLVPEEYASRGLPRRILVAWSPTREASRATHDALPLLVAAEQVKVVVVASDWDIPEQNPGDDIARHLARHGVGVEVKHVPTAARLFQGCFSMRHVFWEQS